MNALLKANTNKKQSFLGGAAVLALAALLSSGIASAEKTVLLTFTGDVTLGGKDEGRNLDTT